MSNTTDHKNFFLMPGKMVFCSTPTRVITILGSCVAIILHSKVRKMGAICHAIYPDCKIIGLTETPLDKKFSFVDTGIEYMLRTFQRRSINKEEIIAKVFGGAHITNPDNHQNMYISIGKRNVDAVFDYLSNKEITITSDAVGGTFGRKIIYHSETGDVFLKDQVPVNHCCKHHSKLINSE